MVKSTVRRNNIILLDYSSVAMSSLMPQIGEYENNEDLIRHVIVNIIRKFNLEFRREFGEMVICMDGSNNWRRQQYPFYKANRRKNRKKDKHDWTAIFEQINRVRDEVKENIPFKVVHVDRCEADDCIGTIVENTNGKEPIIIVSPDKDFIQLHKYKGVRQWSNIQKKWVIADVHPVIDLETKILRGDSGDGVPNVLSEDDTFLTESRQTPLSKKKIQQLMENPESLGTATARRIMRNRDLIDLSRTPSDIKNEILEQFNQHPKGNIMKLMNMFTKHKMKLMMESLQDFETQ